MCDGAATAEGQRAQGDLEIADTGHRAGEGRRSIDSARGARDVQDPRHVRRVGAELDGAHTGHGAHAAGLDQTKLDAVWAFPPSPLFSAAARAALSVAVAAAQTPNGVTDEQFASLKTHFDDTQIVEIVAVLCLFAFLNRWNHTLATELESSPLNYAREHMGEHGWTPGIHGSGR